MPLRSLRRGPVRPEVLLLGQRIAMLKGGNLYEEGCFRLTDLVLILCVTLDKSEQCDSRKGERIKLAEQEKYALKDVEISS